MLSILLFTAPLPAWAGDEEHFAFAVAADPRQDGPGWRHALQEIRDRRSAALTDQPPAAFLLVVGDFDPAAERYRDFAEIFAGSDQPPFFAPVVGNHDIPGPSSLGEEGSRLDILYIRHFLVPKVPGVVRRTPDSCDYYFDYRHIRLIVVDGYHGSGHRGVINDTGRAWVEKVVEEAPESIEHIFIAFHEPAFPRFRHLNDSFNADPQLRNAFWRMLVRHRSRVRAVFVGHTHHFSRMRIRDPEAAWADDPQRFPDHVGGVYQVDAGAAGQEGPTTVVWVEVKGAEVRYRAFSAQPGPGEPFRLVDSW